MWCSQHLCEGVLGPYQRAMYVVPLCPQYPKVRMVHNSHSRHSDSAHCSASKSLTCHQQHVVAGLYQTTLSTTSDTSGCHKFHTKCDATPFNSIHLHSQPITPITITCCCCWLLHPKLYLVAYKLLRSTGKMKRTKHWFQQHWVSHSKTKH